MKTFVKVVIGSLLLTTTSCSNSDENIDDDKMEQDLSDIKVATYWYPEKITAKIAVDLNGDGIKSTNILIEDATIASTKYSFDNKGNYQKFKGVYPITLNSNILEKGSYTIDNNTHSIIMLKTGGNVNTDKKFFSSAHLTQTNQGYGKRELTAEMVVGTNVYSYVFKPSYE